MDGLHVISDPTRREILRLVWDRERPAGEIADRFPVTFGAVSQHLGVLRDSGFVTVRPEGNRRFYRADHQALGPLRAVLEAMWATSPRSAGDRGRSRPAGSPASVPAKAPVSTESDAIRLERRIAAPPDAVFRYLTESTLWSRWQGQSAELDPVPGGRVLITMAEGQVVEGTYVEIDHGRRVVITWGWVGHPRMPPGTTTVEFDLVADGTGTILRLTHTGLPLEDLPIHRQGWDAFVPRLAIAASGGDPGPSPL